MVPSRLRSAHKADVEAGLPTLNAEMVKAGITTPLRVAAFISTIAHESYVEYNIRQIGATSEWAGRGYIQLTGKPNYIDAGTALKADLVNNPDLARSLTWSAKVAMWYWTVARPRCNEYADKMQMGKINAAIGYPLGDGAEDQRRCAAFVAGVKYLTGVAPSGVSCSR